MRATLVAFLLCCVSALAAAQTAAPPVPANVIQTRDANGPPDAPVVFDTHDNSPAAVGYAHSYYRNSQRVGLDEALAVHVNNFSTLLAHVDGDCTRIILFLDGMAIRGLKPEACDPPGHLRYRLARTPDADPVWHRLRGSARGYAKLVSVSVGRDASAALPSAGVHIELEVLPPVQFRIFVALVAVMLLVFVILCRRTSLIRSGSPEIPPAQRPFSLSLFQMAFWFFVVTASYAFLWLINDELDTITESVLLLLGIGAGTALGAVFIDKKKPNVAAEKSQGFLTDLLTDATGVSLHRFQMFVWTLILGLIFIASVYKNNVMPEFSATLLGLMGLSSGTYLGFKIPENVSTDTPAGMASGAGVAESPKS